VNPLLLGGGVLALLAWASMGTTTPASSYVAPPVEPPPPPQPTPIAIAVTPPAPVHPIDASGDYSATLSLGDDTTTSSTFTEEPSGQAPLHDDWIWWVNHYTGSNYLSGATIPLAVIQQAVANAVAHESNVYMLLEFSVILSGYGNTQLGQVLENRAMALETAAVAQGTQKWAGSSTVDYSTIQQAYSAAMSAPPTTMADAQDMHDFGVALIIYESSNQSPGPFYPQGNDLIMQSGIDIAGVAAAEVTPPPAPPKKTGPGPGPGKSGKGKATSTPTPTPIGHGGFKA
jgi:hypothetical protein